MPIKFDLPDTNNNIIVVEGKVGNWIKEMELYLNKELDILMYKQMDLPVPSHPIARPLNPNSKYYYIRKDNKNVGYFICTPGMIPPLVWISSFYVRKESRSEGIGNEAFQQMKSILKKEGYLRIMLKVDAMNIAERLYRKNGFDTMISQILMCKL